MSKHKKKFLLPSDRAELLKAIERGDIIERASIPTQPTQPLPQKTHQPTPPASEHTIELQTSGTETTGRELIKIFSTAVVLVTLVICLAVVQAKTPYINELSAKLGNLLSI